MTDDELTYVILESSLKTSIVEQENLQSINIKEIIEQSSEIKKLSDIINAVEESKILTCSTSQ